MDYLRLAKDAAVNTGHSITGVWDAYVGHDKTPRLLIGVGALMTFVGGMFGSLHLTANSIDIMKNMRPYFAAAREKGLNALMAFVKSFTKYQNAKKQQFDQAAAKAEQELSGGVGELTEAQLKDLEYHIERIKEENSNSAISRTWRGIKKVVGWPFSKIAPLGNSLKFWKRVALEVDEVGFDAEQGAEAADRLVEDITKKTKFLKKIETFPRALRQFFFSYPSLLTTYKFVGRIWNYGFIGRSFVLRPKLWYMMATYPKFFRTTISGESGIQVPTKFNGGLRRTWQTGRFWANYKTNKGFFNTDKEALELIKKYEKDVLPVEGVVTQLAMEKSIKALVRYVDDPKKLEDFFDSAGLPKMGLTNDQIRSGVSPTTGFSSLVDKKIKKILNRKERTYFRAYFNKVFESTMVEYLKEVAIEQGESPESLEGLSPEEIKYATLQHSKYFQVDKDSEKNTRAQRDRAQRIMSQIEKETDIVHWAHNIATGVSKILQRLSVNYQHDTMKSLRDF
jgi:hypothetical protein